MADHTLRLNPGLESEVLRAFAPELAAGCMAVAERAADIARSLAPHGSGVTGRGNAAGQHYADTIRAERTRAGARVTSDSPLAAIIEFGAPGHQTFGNPGPPLPPQWVFRRAGEATGLAWRRRA